MSRKYNKYERLFEKELTEYSNRTDLVFINIFTKNYYKSDTIIINGSLYNNDIISIVIPGSQTFNFAQLYKLNDKDTLPVDSSACLSRQFMMLNMYKHEGGDYLLKEWGCHFGHSLILTLN